MILTAQHFIETYDLESHPEGGYYKETHRSQSTMQLNIQPQMGADTRNVSTAIYFLLVEGNFSAFHKISSDECWHFYHGDPLTIYVIHPDGHLQKIILGGSASEDEVFQAVVPAGSWFASETNGSYSFVGCTVAPGFDFNDFELARKDILRLIYPAHTKIIERFTRR